MIFPLAAIGGQIFAGDGDLRPERCAAFAQVVNAFDAQLADTIARHGTA